MGQTASSSLFSTATNDDALDAPARVRGGAGDVPNARPFADGDIPVTAPPRSFISRGDVALSTGDFRRPGDDPYAAYMARARLCASLSNPSTSPDSPITPLTTEGCPVTVQTPLGAVDSRRGR